MTYAVVAFNQFIFDHLKEISVMNVKAEIKTIHAVIHDAMRFLDEGDLESAKNFIYALQIYLNQSHRQRSMWSSKSLQYFCLN